MEERQHHFINDFIEEDLRMGKVDDKVHTRFPPEPNGYLHIGHAKAMCVDFGTALEFDGLCNLRFDDTNPVKEDNEYVEAIQDDIHWLGFDWGDRLFFGSDYFEQTYEYAVELIKKGLAYVCELSPEEMKAMRGDYNTPAQSPYRDRPIEESLDLFRRMRAGEFPEGAMTLRAKIDLASGNWNMRDPALYRIRFAEHHRQGNKWCIYPMYDFAHPIQDALEGITHSLCSLEYEAHRPLYEWVINNCSVPHKPRQIEFARLNLSYTVMSKRKLRQLVEKGIVSGWDDPRMPTLAGMRRRGYTPAAIRKFCRDIGVAKADSMVGVEMLESCIRDDLNKKADRVMAVMKPLRVTLTNYPEGVTEALPVENNPEDENAGKREIIFSRELFIDADDFMEKPVKGFHRLYPGNEVRLKGAYIICCDEVEKDAEGNIIRLLCSYDADTKSGSPAADRKVKGTIQWVEANTAVDAEIRLYDRLFAKENPDETEEGQDFTDFINPDSLVTVTAKLEPCLKDAEVGKPYQFMRIGYFTPDLDSTPEKLIFNRTVALRDSWAKKQK